MANISKNGTDPLSMGELFADIAYSRANYIEPRLVKALKVAVKVYGDIIKDFESHLHVTFKADRGYEPTSGSLGNSLDYYNYMGVKAGADRKLLKRIIGEDGLPAIIEAVNAESPRDKINVYAQFPVDVSTKYMDAVLLNSAGHAGFSPGNTIFLHMAHEFNKVILSAVQTNHNMHLSNTAINSLEIVSNVFNYLKDKYYGNNGFVKDEKGVEKINADVHGIADIMVKGAKNELSAIELYLNNVGKEKPYQIMLNVEPDAVSERLISNNFRAK